MNPKQCAVCGKATFKEYVLTLAGRRLRTIEAWLCGDTCASAYFEEDVV
jgi:hypothetical protein